MEGGRPFGRPFVVSGIVVPFTFLLPPSPLSKAKKGTGASTDPPFREAKPDYFFFAAFFLVAFFAFFFFAAMVQTPWKEGFIPADPPVDRWVLRES